MLTKVVNVAFKETSFLELLTESNGFFFLSSLEQQKENCEHNNDTLQHLISY